MSVFTELIQKSSALKSAEKEIKQLRQDCLAEMAKSGETKLVLPNMGSISLRTRKPSRKKIDDPEILQLREDISNATEELALSVKESLYDLQREMFLVQRDIYKLLRSTEIVSLQALLFEKTHEYLQRESTEYLVVRAHG